MNKAVIYIIIFIIIFLAVLISGLLFGIALTTGQVIGLTETQGVEIDFDYTHTKAICEGNSCRDYEIVCFKGEAIRVDPISGVVVFPDDWKDLREDKGLCEKDLKGFDGGLNYE